MLKKILFLAAACLFTWTGSAVEHKELPAKGDCSLQVSNRKECAFVRIPSGISLLLMQMG